MKQDFSELIEYLDKEFQKTAKKEDLKKLASKEDLKDISAKLVTLEEFDKFKIKIANFEKEFKSFKNKSLNNQDAALKKLDILLTEKKAKKYQEKKEKKLLLIIIKALREHKILTTKELKQIAQLDIF